MDDKNKIRELMDIIFPTPIKDFSILENFTDEELAEELCRRTSLGKELK